jgi:protein-disulfide isomerase
MSRLLAAVMFVSLAGTAVLPAQTAVPPPGDKFRDTSMLKPPAGAKVAIIEWEDLECPACAHAFPIVHAAVAHYKIPLIRYDFQIPGHIWSHEASLYARYLQDKVSPTVAEDYRRQVFASQYQIGSKDDLHNFTVKFFQTKGQQIPFVLDPTGQFEKEVTADKALGEKLGLQHTPTLVVVTPTHWVEVDDMSQLYSVIDAALAQTAAAAPAKAPVAHSVAPKKTS